MNANTLKAVTRHGESLLRAFPHAIERDPVALCKKLRRIETAVHYAMTQYCNGDLDEARTDAAEESALLRTRKLLGLVVDAPESKGTLSGALFVNRDPRGYALKLSSEWTFHHNNSEYRTSAGVMQNHLSIYTDMGGYGILAPDLNTN